MKTLILGWLLLPGLAFGATIERKLSSYPRTNSLGENDLIAVSRAPGTTNEATMGIRKSDLTTLLLLSAPNPTNGVSASQATNIADARVTTALATNIPGLQSLTTNTALAILGGHLHSNSPASQAAAQAGDAVALAGWSLSTPFSLRTGTNPAAWTEHSLRFGSMGRSLIGAIGDGGGDDYAWFVARNSNSLVLSPSFGLYFSVNGGPTNQTFLLRNNTGNRSVDVGGASNANVGLVASNRTVLRADWLGRVFDLYGRSILDPTNHVASDGGYAWRGPVTTKGISFTNIGATTLVPVFEDPQPDPPNYAAVPNGPGGLSYLISSTISPEAGNDTNAPAYTLRIEASTANPGAGGQGDGWVHIGNVTGGTEGVMLNGSGLHYSPNGTPENRLPLVQGLAEAPAGLASGLAVEVGGVSNRYAALKTSGGYGLLVDELGRWWGSNGNAANLEIYDPSLALFTPFGDLTWGGACYDASVRIAAAGGAGTDLIVSNLLLRGNIALGDGLNSANMWVSNLATINLLTGGQLLVNGGEIYLSTTNAMRFNDESTIRDSTGAQIWKFNSIFAASGIDRFQTARFLDLTNHQRLLCATNTPAATGTGSTNFIIDCSLANVFTINPVANFKLWVTNCTFGFEGWIICTQDGTGSRLMSYNSPNIKTNANLAPSTAAGAVDRYDLRADALGTNVQVQVFKGFQ